MEEQIEKQAIEEMRKDLIDIFDEEYEKRRLLTPQNTAEKMTAKGYRKQEWISVAERLPDEKPTKWKYETPQKTLAILCVSNDVLVTAVFNDNKEEPFISIGNTSQGGVWWVSIDDEDDYEREITVTHWMPLPETPKMKGGAE